MDRKTVFILIAAIVAISLLTFAICVHEKPILKNKRPSPRPSITIEPYRIPLPQMDQQIKSNVKTPVTTRSS